MTPTADDIWRILAELATARQETERILAEERQKTERLAQETERLAQETERSFQETNRILREQREESDRRFQEMDRRFQEQREESDRRFQEMDRHFQEQREESERRFQEQREESERRFQEQKEESERRFQEQKEESKRHLQETERILREQNEETNRKIQEVNKQIGNLGGKWGRFVENMVAPACETLFLNRGIPVHLVSQRVKANLEGKTLELDVLVTNQDHILVVEVKSSLGVDNVKELIEDLAEFREFFPEYNQKQLYGAVAGIDIEEGADKYAYRKGLYVLAQSGESVTILNDERFQPKAW